MTIHAPTRIGARRLTCCRYDDYEQGGLRDSSEDAFILKQPTRSRFEGVHPRAPRVSTNGGP
jgi:hypothetical protein